jgi:mono/diheme cytochrome c family protein
MRFEFGRGISALIGVLAVAISGPVQADDAAPPTDNGEINIKKLFAANCSWCHEGYGMHAGKGPKLAGTAKTEQQISDHIKNGKAGSMPGFAKTLSEREIIALTSYIKGLKPE